MVAEGARACPREHSEVQALLAIDPFPIVCLRVPGVTELTPLPPRWDLHGQLVLVVLSKCSLSSGSCAPELSLNSLR